MAMWIQHSWRLLKHELKRGELTIVALAIILSVSSVFSLSGFSSLVKQSLLADSSKFIAADVIVKSSRAINEEYIIEANSRDIKHVKQVEMASMLFSEENMMLVQLKASSDGYPLRGELLVKTDPNQPAIAVSTPKKGEVWLDKKAEAILGLSIDDSLNVGNHTLTIAGIIEQVPDMSFSVFGASPIVLLHIDDLAATGLVQPGSRLGYSYLLAGDQENLASYESWLTPKLNETQRWRNIQSGNTPLAKALNRAEKYLSLGSMLGVVLAAVAVAVASRRYGQRHQSSVAIFKAMGASKSHILKMYCLHWALLCIFSITIGLFVGFIILSIGLVTIQNLFDITTSHAYGAPLLIAIITGFVCASAFAIQPLKSLVNTSPMWVLRGSQNFSSRTLLSSVISLLAVFGLLYLFSKDINLSAALLFGGLLVSGILLLLAHGLMKLGRQVGSQAGKAWHLALANVKRRANENAIQLISFTLAIKLLLIILVMKNAIIDEWQSQLPKDTANRFLINISEDQTDNLSSFLTNNNIQSSDLYAVVRGRLARINDDVIERKPKGDKTENASNTRQGVGRELNLTWRETLPNKNIIVEGQWWDNSEITELPPVSVEKDIAERLNITLGDELFFTLGNEEVLTVVTSIREVDWQSLQPNFYVIFHPSVLSDFPATYINSIHVDEQQSKALQQFLAQYPTISLLDIEALITQLRDVISRVAIAVQFILILVVLAGSLVLIAQVQASMEERERELAILRTLGAKGRLLALSIFYEFLALGALAGLMASIAMEIAVFVLQTQVFNMSASFHFSYWVLAIIAGASFVGLIGLISCRRLLNLSSITLIRRTM